MTGLEEESNHPGMGLGWGEHFQLLHPPGAAAWPQEVLSPAFFIFPTCKPEMVAPALPSPQK